jgi:hypothetical protein
MWDNELMKRLLLFAISTLFLAVLFTSNIGVAHAYSNCPTKWPLVGGLWFRDYKISVFTDGLLISTNIDSDGYLQDSIDCPYGGHSVPKPALSINGFEITNPAAASAGTPGVAMNASISAIIVNNIRTAGNFFGTDTREKGIEESIIDDIHQQGKFKLSVVDGPTIEVNATNCKRIMGVDNAPVKVVIMRGQSTDLTVGQFLNLANTAVVEGFRNTAPFNTYFGNLSFYIDLREIPDSDFPKFNPVLNKYSIWDDNQARFVKSQSSCNGVDGINSNAAQYIFYYDNGGHPSPAVSSYKEHVSIINRGRSDTGGSDTVLHETAHAFAGIFDEYLYGQTGNINTTMSLLGVGLKNCVELPSSSFRNSKDNLIYGNVTTRGCSFVQTGALPKENTIYYRPSAASIMNQTPNNSADQNKFNVISCGYIVSAILGEPLVQSSASKHWPNVDQVNTNLPGCAGMDTIWDNRYIAKNPTIIGPRIPQTTLIPNTVTTISGTNFTSADNAVQFASANADVAKSIAANSVAWNLGPHWGTWSNNGPDALISLYGDNDNSWPYLGNQNTTATYTNINLADASYRQNGSSLSFTTNCDTELTNPVGASSDYMALEFSGDGITYNEFLRWNRYSLDPTNHSYPTPLWAYAPGDKNVTIPGSYLTKSFAFRFRWVTNAVDNDYGGCFVYNLKIVAINSTTEVTGIPSADTKNITFTIPALRPGKYLLKVGAFNSDWSEPVAVTIGYGQNPSPTPTPTVTPSALIGKTRLTKKVVPAKTIPTPQLPYYNPFLNAVVTPTPIASPSYSPTPTYSPNPSPTYYYTPTPTPTPTQTSSPSPSPTYSPTPSPTNYYTPTPTPSPYYSPSPSSTASPSPSLSPKAYVPAGFNRANVWESFFELMKSLL